MLFAQASAIEVTHLPVTGGQILFPAKWMRRCEAVHSTLFCEARSACLSISEEGNLEICNSSITSCFSFWSQYLHQISSSREQY
jgi:hypothetical protein